jgi:hypothetical protein
MEPLTPRDAQTIVAAYLKVVEDDAAAEIYPGSMHDLPESKETIRAAFRLSVEALVASDQLTPDLRNYLEVGYVSLADYVDDEGARLLREYVRAGHDVAAAGRLARERTSSDAWRQIAEQSRLAGELARAISAEAELLLTEFRSWTGQTDGTTRAPT